MTITKKIPETLAMLTVAFLIFWQFSERGFDFVWIFRWTLLLGMLILTYSYFLGKIISPLYGVVFGYFGLNALLYSTIPIWNLEPRIQQGLHESAILGLATFILLFFLRQYANYRYRMGLRLAFTIMGLVVAVGVYLAPEPRFHVYPLHNPSMTGTFLAIICLMMGSWEAYVVTIPALFFLGSATPWACLLAGILARLMPWGKLTKQLPLHMGVGLLVTLPFGFFALPKLVAGGNGRFDVWRVVIQWLFRQELWVKLFGAGLGSTPILVPILQLKNGMSLDGQSFFMYLHNDWLQLLFETGIVGFALSVTFFGSCLWRARNQKSLFSALAGYSVAMATNFPMHAPLTALLGVFLLGEVLP